MSAIYAKTYFTAAVNCAEFITLYESLFHLGHQSKLAMQFIPHAKATFYFKNSFVRQNE